MACNSAQWRKESVQERAMACAFAVINVVSSLRSAFSQITHCLRIMASFKTLAKSSQSSPQKQEWRSCNVIVPTHVILREANRANSGPALSFQAYFVELDEPKYSAFKIWLHDDADFFREEVHKVRFFIPLFY
jgi:hypothetical protein